MSYRSEERPYRSDVVTIPIVWLMILLSLLVHFAALWMLIPDLQMLALENQPRSEDLDRLQVQLAPPPATRLPQPAPPRVPEPAVAPPKPPAKPIFTPPRRPAPKPPVIAAPGPAAPVVPAPPVVPPTPEPPRTYPPMAGDLSSYIEARKRERGEVPAPAAAGKPANVPSAASDNGRINDALAANLPSPQSPIEGRDRRRGGGIFEIKRMAYDDAAFEFYGWNTDMGRKTAQLIEVRKGDNSDMRIAVIRRMIAIIRQHEQGDFVWESQRLGHNLTLSARPADTAGLEEFMMQEFFEGSHVR
jgi:hypothetical protein